MSKPIGAITRSEAETFAPVSVCEAIRIHQATDKQKTKTLLRTASKNGTDPSVGHDHKPVALEEMMRLRDQFRAPSPYAFIFDHFVGHAEPKEDT